VDNELFQYAKGVKPGEPRRSETESVLEHTLRGEVLRVVFCRDDGQWVVIKLLCPDGQEHTCVGPLAGLLEGQDIEATGRWETHREHGKQFRVSQFRAVLPTTEAGVRRYLASGLVYGIGPVLANRIVDRFGANTMEVLERASERLHEVPGIGGKRLADIRKAWVEHSQQRDAMVFLQGLGISPGCGARMLARYGMAAPEVVRRNPYQLASEVQGIGFLTADRIAHELGIQHDSLLRLAAGTLYVLDRLAEDGHTCYPRSQLLQEVTRVLDVDEPHAAAGLEQALLNGGAVAELVVPGDSEPCVYCRRLCTAETELAAALHVLLRAPFRAMDPPVETLGAGYRRLNEAQRQAVHAAFRIQLSIITGGPGVGKTTVVGQIVAAARRLGCQILLAAPTGRAAKRLTESTNLRAATIHRLLKWDPASRAFVHDRSRPLRCDMLIVDEVSMLDTALARDLLIAVRPGTHVVFVGDRDQLPSVGPGCVLHDLIASNRIPVTQLTEIYRQDEHSRIVSNAHCVNRGTMPDLRSVQPSQLVDFYWIDQDDPERAADVISRMVAERIPERFGLNPVTDIQVLAPMHRGTCGAQSLNEILQQRLNPDPKPQFQVGERRFRSGDRVMQVVNNYDKGVFNGELGQIVHVDAKNKTFRVHFDVGPVDYDFHEAVQIQLAYAVTVHKSQGSEFPCVVMPVLTQHYIMLQRNLVYTGMTRARRLLVMVGTRKALAIAIRNDRPQLRWSRLCARLQVEQPSGRVLPARLAPESSPKSNGDLASNA